MQPPTINTTVTALRFFFKVMLDRPETTRHLVFVYQPRKLPRVLSPEGVLRLLEAAPGPKHKAALSVAYGAGLRSQVSEGAAQRRALRIGPSFYQDRQSASLSCRIARPLEPIEPRGMPAIESTTR
jgi:integrase